MNCIGPIIPSDADLLAYADLHGADDGAQIAVRQHVAQCAACQLRAHALDRAQRTLQILLHRAGCPSPLELGEYHLHLLSEQQSETVARHLSYCPACRAEVSQLAAFIARLRRPLADAAQDLFGALRTIAAQLSVSPLAGPSLTLAPALRGGDDDVDRAPLVYTAEDVLVTVDCWVERAGQPGRVVAGLVVGPVDFADAEASLDAGSAPSTAPINNLGNFLFSAVSAGQHQLMIRLPATGIQIEIAELMVR